MKIFKKKTKKQFRINVLNSRQLKKKFILINSNKAKTSFIKKNFIVKKIIFFLLIRNLFINILNSKFIKKIKFKFYNKNISKINILQDIVLRYHGLIFIKNKILKESLDKDSMSMNFIVIALRVLIIKWTDNVNSQCIVLPTGINSLAHYLFESDYQDCST